MVIILNGQDKPIKGRYGNNDLRIRAGNGLIYEGRMKKFDFDKTGLKNIAVIYWPDENLGFQKIGLTIFENARQNELLDSSFISKNTIFLEERLNYIHNIKFSLINKPKNILELFQRKPVVSQVKILNLGKPYLDSLKSLSFDGLFIIFEDKFQDLITGGKSWLPSKGIFKFYNKELVYYGVYSTLIDLNKLKSVKNIGYKQLSADYSQIPFKEINFMNETQKRILFEELTKRFENNIEEIIRIHKLK